MSVELQLMAMIITISAVVIYILNKLPDNTKEKHTP